VDLEVAGADRGLNPVTVASRVRERLRHGGLADSEEAQSPQLRRLRPREQCAYGLALERVSPQTLQLDRRARQHDYHVVAVLQNEPWSSSGEAQRVGALRDRGLLADPGLEVHVGPPQPVRERVRDVADLLVQLLVEAETHS
jgi:hypothetical protein